MKSRRPRPAGGFTLVEVLVAMTLTGIVVAGTLRALSAQKKFYARQARILDARHAMRAATTILASELREASPGGGDLYAVAADSVAIRSTVGFGVACAVNEAAGQLALIHVSGHFRLDAGDSVVVFVENGEPDSDDAWRALGVSAIGTTGPACAWGTPSERLISVSGSLNGVWVGGPVRLFRAYAYAPFQLEGRWWLGRRDRSEPDYVPVAGPLAPPDSGGLQFFFFDPNGNTTLNPSQVARVSITVRAPTYRSLSDPAYRSLSTSAYLRN